MTTRILAIIQLCIAFSLLCWQAAAPFAGDHYAYRKEAELYHSLTSGVHQKRFESLPDTQQHSIIKEKNLLDSEFNKNFFEKSLLSLKAVLSLPPFILIWAFLTIPAAVFALKKRSSAPALALFLPLTAAIYGVDNLYFGTERRIGREAALFPSEDELSPNLTGGVFEQQSQLTEAWRRYLIEEWAGEAPDPKRLEEQVKEGEFSFLLARLDAVRLDRREAGGKASKMPFPFLAVFFFWNLLFAMSVGRAHKVEAEHHDYCGENGRAKKI